MLKRIADESKNKTGRIKLHTFWLFVGAMNYDMEKKYPGMFDPLEDTRITPGMDTSFDFYYISVSENTDTLSLHYHRDTDFTGGSFILFKKNN